MSKIVCGSSVADVARLLADEKEIYIIYDRNVADIAAVVVSALNEIPDQVGDDGDRHGRHRPAISSQNVKEVIGFETSEEHKTMDTAVMLADKLLEANASRGALVLAIGGGITTDVAGFAASIYKRGIRWAAFPTTLLAQVDAAIGGKTGVNLHGYKNMLGAFHMPEFTFLTASVLENLPPREFHCGLAEMLKTFLIGDAAAYETCVTGGFTTELIYKAASIKADIVARDPLEHGERAVLNLGHTFGHAIEHCSKGAVAHGEAVAMGIILAARLSEGLGLAPKGLAARLEADFLRVGLETACPYGIEELAEAMKKDKKDGKFVLLKGIGEPVIMTVSQDDLRKYTK